MTSVTHTYNPGPVPESTPDPTTTETPTATLDKLYLELGVARHHCGPDESRAASFDREAELWRALIEAVITDPERRDAAAHLLITAAVVAEDAAQENARWWRREIVRRKTTSGHPA